MADVAARAGVSAMTVSRALKDGSTVSAATRARIMQAVEELGYVLDLTAGTLSSKRTGFVAVLIPSLNNSNFSDTARGIERRLEGSGLQMLLGATDYDIAQGGAAGRGDAPPAARGPGGDGGRHTARARRQLDAAGIPVVEMWDLPDEPLEHVVGFSNAAAAGAMVRAPPRARLSRHRLYRRLDRPRHARHGPPPRLRAGGARPRAPGGPDDRLRAPPIAMQQGGEAVVDLLDRHPEVDAVLCVSDLSAFGALAECQRRGWAVPGRLAIAGFGDFELSRSCHPRLTTVSVDALGIGDAVGDLLLRAVASGRDRAPLPPETVRTPFAVTARETS